METKNLEVLEKVVENKDVIGEVLKRGSGHSMAVSLATTFTTIFLVVVTGYAIKKVAEKREKPEKSFEEEAKELEQAINEMKSLKIEKPEETEEK